MSKIENKKIDNQASVETVVEKKQGKIRKYYASRKRFFAISAFIMLLGVIFIFINGVHLDIQFKGGALIKYAYTGEIDTDGLEIAAETATEVLGRPTTVQSTSDLTSNEKKLVVNIAGESGIEASEQDKLNDALKEKFPENNLTVSDSQMVQPYFGQKFLMNGITSLLLAAALVVIYVWIRFRRIGGLSAGMMALAALFHDMIVVFFVFVIFRIPIGESFVAVALTIIGYSINDTIVIYDRIRENRKNYGKMPIEDIVDLSVSQSLTRSIMTNLAVMISVSMVYILAFANNIETVQSFALPMAIGSISGCYSTICIAGPLWVTWKKRSSRDRSKKK